MHVRELYCVTDCHKNWNFVFTMSKIVLPTLLRVEVPYSGFFEDKNFHELAFPRFSRGKFFTIVMHFEGKLFMNCFRFMKFAKISPSKNNPLYGIASLQIAKPSIVAFGREGLKLLNADT